VDSSQASSLAQRRLHEGQRYDDASNKMVAQQLASDRQVYFSIDVASGMAETPAARRDFGLLIHALKRSRG
jgi:hypothetical protein